MFTGCGTAMVTPFGADGSLDEAAMRRLVRRQIESGIDFLVPCGTTGESPTLSREEHLRVVAITVEEARGKKPVLAGAGGYNTHEVIELARECFPPAIQRRACANPHRHHRLRAPRFHHRLRIRLRQCRRTFSFRDIPGNHPLPHSVPRCAARPLASCIPAKHPRLLPPDRHVTVGNRSQSPLPHPLALVRCCGWKPPASLRFRHHPDTPLGRRNVRTSQRPGNQHISTTTLDPCGSRRRPQCRSEVLIQPDRSASLADPALRLTGRLSAATANALVQKTVTVLPAGFVRRMRLTESEKREDTGRRAESLVPSPRRGRSTSAFAPVDRPRRVRPAQ